MKIFVNDESRDFAGQTVADLAAELSLPEQGVAIAIGMNIIARAEWGKAQIADGDKVLVIRAHSGG